MVWVDEARDKVAMMKWQQYCNFKGPECGKCYKPGHWVDRPECFKGTMFPKNHRDQVEKDRFAKIILTGVVRSILRAGRVKTRKEALEYVKWAGIWAEKQLHNM